MPLIFGIMFAFMVAMFTCVVVEENHQEKLCEAKGGVFVYNQQGSNLCYPPGTLIKIN